jgi:hypothetical protein
MHGRQSLQAKKHSKKHTDLKITKTVFYTNEKTQAPTTIEKSIKRKPRINNCSLKKDKNNNIVIFPL